MVNTYVSLTGQQTKHKIGSTTYIVTPHFPKKGTTAVDKVKYVMDRGIKPRGSCHR